MGEKVKISCYNCQQKLDVTDLEPFIKIRCPVCNTDIIIPKPFGNLILEENLGTGEIATSYRAMDRTLDREIIVKVLNPKLAANAELAISFVSEARSTSAINHPNVVPIYSCGEMEDQPYIVMQFMGGGGLDKKIAMGKRPAQLEALRWMLDAIKGLDAAHMHGLLHHDLRPSNIFLDFDNNVKVGAFGLTEAVFCGISRDGETKKALVPEGNPGYFSPEKATTGRQDVRGDIFSLGAAFYHLITGSRPFEGDSVAEQIKSRQAGLKVQPIEYRKDLRKDVNDMLVRMLAVSPGDRFSAYAEIKAIVSAAIEDLEAHETRDTIKSMKPPTVNRPGSSTRIARLQGLRELNDAAKDQGVGLRGKTLNLISSKTEADVLKGEDITDPEFGRYKIKQRSQASHFIVGRLIPALAIGLLIILLAGHIVRPPWYIRTIQPLIERIFPSPDAEADNK